MQRWSFAGRILAFSLLAGLGVGCAPKRLAPLEPGEFPVPPDREQIVVPEILDLGLVQGKERLLLLVDGPALVLDAETRKRLFRFGPAGGELQCTRSGNSVAWSRDNQRGINSSIVLQPLDPAQRVSHEQQEYRGDFLVIPTPQLSGLTLINQVELESYLYGVVPWEIGRHGQEKEAALAAQAVAARTYTISHLGSRRALGFDLFASVMDQVYKGCRHEDDLCNQAVDETRALVLKCEGQLVDAYYSACCGGTCSRVEKVWPRQAEVYLVDHPDSPGPGELAFCSASKHFDWVEKWSAVRLEEILQHTLPAYIDYMTQGERSSWAHPMFSPRRGGVDPMSPGKLLDLEIQDYTPSGRIAQLVITTEAGVYYIRGDRTRWVLTPASGKPAILRSAKFEVEKIRRDGQLTEVSVRGKGYGHGIGLCQTGSLEMAARGYSALEILSHYYPGSELRHLGRAQ